MRLPSRQVAGLSVCAVRVSFFACMSAVECDLTALFSVSVFPGLSRSFPVFLGIFRSLPSPPQKEIGADIANL